jgi:hypothetical protein
MTIFSYAEDFLQSKFIPHNYWKENGMEDNNLDSRPMFSQGQALRGNDTKEGGNDKEVKRTSAIKTGGGSKRKVKKRKLREKKVSTPAIVTPGNAPQSKEELHAYVKKHLGMDVPSVSMCSGHDAPMDYLWHAYSADFADLPGALGAEDSADCIVWAGRGGGKTRLAAAATLLDSIFKDGCKTRILAGSLEQSSLMYDYFCDYAQSEKYRELLESKIRVGRCRFNNKSEVRILAHSQRDVRGIHIHKLRCDEAELFREDVFKAAQFVTKSRDKIRGAMEVFSTMHQPYGVMQRLIDGAAESRVRVFQWCVWEVIEKCGPDRSCSQCPLWKDCGGKAKNAVGYLKIDDVIDQMRRSSRKGFEAEMLSLRPQMDNAVFDEFSLEEHVRPMAYDADLPLYLAMDFGYLNPFVCLWIQVDNNGFVRVIDEYIQNKTIISKHGEAVILRTPGGVGSIRQAYCDPAGNKQNTVTGTSDIEELGNMGIFCKSRYSEISDGVKEIRKVLKNGEEKSHFVVDPKCRQLIEAMRCYHYPQDVAKRANEQPVKDNVYDHPIDALRYFFVNHIGIKSKSRRC